MQNNYFNKWKKNKGASILLSAFFIISLFEIIAEYYHDTFLIWFTKPLVIPLLIFYYLKRSEKVNLTFVLALFFSWIANLLFIQNAIHFIYFGVFFFLI